MNNKLSELSKPVAEVVSKFGDPEAFGEREVKLLIGIQQMAYGTKFYSQEYVSALDDVAQYWIGQSAEWKERAEAADQRIAELEQAMRHIHGAALDITVPRAAIAKAAELAVEHASMKEQSNG
ncbi:Uncharacterised protein [Serratia ficaria]|uniref:hypothetical protein n=1 Tax=Serratia ficaria TaxID=61651 RepID=UPI00217AA8E1|nr:hypothetical protein [Serratia ficaria]CAI1104118.1 Uncharacterised protein [Serratia ficaria]CAI1941175.1 Uncharacterised protein [Serratia ficaria]CAI2465477.1 Uncharacterised protein [Serratia ficaria]